MSMGLAREDGGGFQQLDNLANASRMVLTWAGSASLQLDETSSSAVANQMS